MTLMLHGEVEPCTHPSPSQLNSRPVWGIFWTPFETGVLIGVAVFERTPDQMRYEAYTSRVIFPSPCTLADLTISSSLFLEHMTVMTTCSFCDTSDTNAASRAVLLSL